MHFDWNKSVKPSGIPVSPWEIQASEDQIGFAFPADYVAFLLAVNGGKIVGKHDIPLPQFSCSVNIDYLYPLNARSPFAGIMDARRTQVAMKLGLREMIEIGGDGGTGEIRSFHAGVHTRSTLGRGGGQAERGATRDVWGGGEKRA